MLLAIAMLASGFASEVFAWALVIMQGHSEGGWASGPPFVSASTVLHFVYCVCMCVSCD